MNKIGLLLGSIMMMGLALVGCTETNNTENKVTTDAISAGAVQSADTLKDAYDGKFSMGVAINCWQLEDEKIVSIIKEQFNSITFENEMKPESLLDWQASEESKDGMPVIKEAQLDKCLTLAKDNGLKVRGHCLVWYNQTPAWFFCKNYDEGADHVDAKTMEKRMESYIKQVITYCNTNYPGIVYAWDVVNEAGSDTDSDYRMEDNNWYDVMGSSYVEKAFEYAREYAGAEAKLFYNDYNSFESTKRDFAFAMVKKLKEAGNLDGMGMQSHWTMDYPDVDLIETAMEKYSTIEGLEIQMTEIDMNNTSDSEASLEAQAQRYKEIFQMVVKLDKAGANITNATFWGLSDDVTWLTGANGEDSYPLLFDGDLEAKPALKAIIDAAK